MSNASYRADIDGLRAIAVVLVLLFHANFGVPGGFIGVDVFFVLSGFLITRLIISLQQSDGFDLSQFWLRRIRRILPASTFMVLVTLAVGYLTLLPDDYQELAESAAAQTTMLSNVFFWRHTGYFEGEAELKPLLHTWSLAIEEQFYVGYPLLLMALTRSSQIHRGTILGVLTLISFGASEYGTIYHPSATFYLLPTRAWELLLGGFLCHIPIKHASNKLINECLGVLGIVSILLPAFLLSVSSRFPGCNALVPCLGTATVIYSNSIMLTVVGRALASRIFVIVGLMSYSLYLWHWPVLSFMRHIWIELYSTEPDTLSRLLGLFLCAVLSFVSWKFVEKPFRSGILLSRPSASLSIISVSILVVLIASLSVAWFQGVPGRFGADVIRYASAKKSKSFNFVVTTKEMHLGIPPSFGARNGAFKCLIWGDSHAMSLVAGLDVAGKKKNVRVFQATRNATAPLLQFVNPSREAQRFAPDFSRSVVDFAVSHGVDVVILSGRWTYYSSNREFERCLNRTIDELTSADIHVAIVRDWAAQDFNVPLMLSGAARLGRPTHTIGIQVNEHYKKNAIGDQILASKASPRVTILDPARLLVDETGLWRAELNGVSMYYDDDHLSDEGSLRLCPLFEDLFDGLGQRNEMGVESQSRTVPGETE